MGNSRTYQLLVLLREIQNVVPSTINAAITTTDGLRVVNLLPGSYDDNVFNARGAVILSTAYQLVECLQLGRLDEVVISARQQTYLIIPITDEIFVEVLIDDRTAISHLISEIRLKSPLLAHIWND